MTTHEHDIDTVHFPERPFVRTAAPVPVLRS